LESVFDYEIQGNSKVTIFSLKMRSSLPSFSLSACLLCIQILSELSLNAASEEERSARHVQRANEMRDMGDVQGALLDYNEAIRLDALNAEAYLNRGITRQNMKQPDTASDDYTIAIQIDPTLSAAYIQRGLVSMDKNDPEGAIADFSEAIRVDPENTKAYALRAQAKFDEKDYAGAIVDYTATIALNPDNPKYLCERGKAKMKNGELDEALKDYTFAIERFPGYARAYYLRGNLLLEMGDLARAIKEFDKAVKASNGSSGALLMRGFISYAQGKSKKALNDMRVSQKTELKQEARNYTQLWLWLAETQLGQPGLAESELKTYFHHRSKDGEDFDPWYKTLVHFFLGDIDEDSLLAKANEGDDEEKIAGQLCEAYFYAAQLRLLRGDRTGSIPLLEQSVASGLTDFYEYKGAKVQLSN
jgi:lipoprotein NlpI